MTHMKDIIIYKNDVGKIYINQCIRAKKARTRTKKAITNNYAIRGDDITGLSNYLGGIKWNGSWRQYVFEPDEDTIWSSSCLEKIISFMIEINKNHRNKLQLKKRVLYKNFKCSKEKI